MCKSNEEINTILSGELEKYVNVFFGWLKMMVKNISLAKAYHTCEIFLLCFSKHFSKVLHAFLS